MRLSKLLSKHLTDAANIQESNSVNYFNLCATIWMVRIFEGTPALSRVLFQSITESLAGINHDRTHDQVQNLIISLI
jgi:hypothetical protein